MRPFFMWLIVDKLPGVMRQVFSGAARTSPKAPTVGTRQPLSGIEESFGRGVDRETGFSLYAGVAAKADGARNWSDCVGIFSEKGESCSIVRMQQVID
jgi:hypothetical protein